jgi:hypothetical protein
MRNIIKPILKKIINLVLIGRIKLAKNTQNNGDAKVLTVV